MRECEGMFGREYSLMEDQNEPIGALFAIIGGITFIAIPLFLPPHGSATLHASYIPLVVAVLLVVVGIWSFHTKYAVSYSWVGRGGLWVLGLGTFGLLPYSLHPLLADSIGTGILIMLIWRVAIVLIGIGAVGIGIDSYRTGLPTPLLGIWFPAALLVPVVFTVVTDGVDWLWHDKTTLAIYGPTWIAFGVTVRRHSNWEADEEQLR